MLQSQSTEIVFCAGCVAETVCTERGWRAYVTVVDDRPAAVVVLCPACSEQMCGEDEAHESS